ncbi:MAG: hypothetical protein QF787_17695, partial [Nitrospinota bacterium]|nr:hypothetical protein [Nitrospinota bacterium]
CVQWDRPPFTGFCFADSQETPFEVCIRPPESENLTLSKARVTSEIVNPPDAEVHLGPKPFPFFRFQDSATSVILLQKLDPDNWVALSL